MSDTPAKTVLLVEDEAGLRELYEEELRQAGWVVFAVGNGEEGLALAENRLPDSVILDVMLPGMSGLDVLAAMRQRETLANIPVIILSALEDIDDRARGLALGAVKYFGKNEASPALIIDTLNELVSSTKPSESTDPAA